MPRTSIASQYPGNVSAPLRWSIDSAAREYGVTRDLVRRRLIGAKEAADPVDHCYSTAQIVHAIYGDFHGEKLKEVREKAEHWSLKNAVMRGDMLDRAMILRGMEHIVLAAARLIDASSMTKQEKLDLRNTLSSWPVVVKSVTESKIRGEAYGENGENGESSDGDEREA